MKEKLVEFIEANKIIAICRGIYGENLVKLISALSKGGVKLVEVTFDQGDKDCISKTSGAISLL
ncbi:MAG TPA: 2-dehydro-3-deoxyphosphogluconate aldolase, partial [Clostridiaceae bacterium]|nr:2-dehydro-3-deoxyphosphogluconate aldolase [Clostridiaceae bacterium]